MKPPDDLPSLAVRPIGLARTPFADRASAPRQPYASSGAKGTIELFEGENYEHALEDLAGFDHIWVIFWFHLNESWRPKVLPPRSTEKRGVFATRAPHRPNPLGLSVMKLERIEGLTLYLENLDLLDGTPILDIKPYVPMADAIPSAQSGWLEPRDPQPPYDLVWSPLANEQLDWLEQNQVHLREPITKVLAIGPEPHPYRRIKPSDDGGFCLAVKDWRVQFDVHERTVTIASIGSGYRERELASSADPAVALQRAFLARFEK